MRNIVIGTAGHIDHGKTTLIRNLTGVDTDTLPEEKKRGMTINLGFTYLTLESGKRVGLVDVPGHEKFIKNMVAGVSGIDFMMLVVAADDGVMPQTREHLNVIRLLGIKRGVVVVTKTDLVSPERVAEVREEIREEFRGSFVDRCEILEVNSGNLDSYKPLKELLNSEIEKIEDEDEGKNNFRLSVDRVFNVKGFGTVVTGTSTGTKIYEGDNLTLYPSMKSVRVRGIQNHGVSVESLEPGNRCALNLGGVDVKEITRGDILATPDSLSMSDRIDVNLSILEGKKKIKNNHRIRLHLGTTEVIGRIRLFGVDELAGGEESLAQLMLEDSIVGLPGDIGVVRNYSPMDTIGSVKILNMKGERVKRKNTEYIESLTNLLSGGSDYKVEKWLDENSSAFPTMKDIAIGTGSEIAVEVIEKLMEEGKVFCLSSIELKRYFHINYLQEAEAKVVEFLKEYHERNPLKSGANKSEVKNKCFAKKLKVKNYNEIFEIMEARGVVKANENLVSLADFKVKLTKKQKKVKDIILVKYKEMGFKPPKYSELEDLVEDKVALKEMHTLLIDNGLLIPLEKDICFMKGFFNEGEKRIRERAESSGKITLAETREALETSRKFALAFLEKLDSLGVTKRVEDYRVIK
ncbi:selenocysteine-specific translation factor [Propionigenium maris DSM 9537]|uniref:Selenocysteine-specific elongation factor n=1 Tax=Propionigenium maris DSM 9537 TaxID=1123000 RepID=A0A9W6LMU5_9FUSO|nr:selenocysteine-specific translation elongation factor [Propionigenium maris]GLI56194.1 selenocysteine-specific translation factor [Propionigenium maris DSM 9537]